MEKNTNVIVNDNVNENSKWIYNNTVFNDNNIPEDALGFVYLITHKSSNKKYIGKKLFWSKIKRKPLKGKKKCRRELKPSDWKTYCSSCREIIELVGAEGVEAFSWEILSLHRSKSSMNYEEARLQFEREVLLRDDYFNGIINIRLGKFRTLKEDKINKPHDRSISQ